MKFASLSIVVAALLTVTGCSAAGTAAAPGTSGPATSSAAGTAPAKSALIVKFGETVKYADGVEVTVKHAGPGTASNSAAPDEARGAEYQLFEITLVNNTADTFDPSAFFDSAVYGKAGKPAEKVFDSANGLSGGNFSGIIIPGGTQTVKAGWLIPAAELPSTVFSLRPGFRYNAAVVTGGL